MVDEEMDSNCTMAQMFSSDSSMEYNTSEEVLLYHLNNQTWSHVGLNLLNATCKRSSDAAEAFGGGLYSTIMLGFARIMYGIVCLVGLLGNSLVIYVVLRFSKMQTVTNTYIFNLAVADEMFLIGLPFLIATATYKYWPFGKVMCKVYMTTTSINQFTSSLLLTVMSADRYVAVCHPISSPRYRTTFVAKLVCLTTWTISALLMVPIFMYADAKSHQHTVSCNIYWPENELMNGQKAFTLYSFTLGFFIPLILILLFYFLVICKLKRVGPKNKSKEKKKSHRKVTILVLTVITVYVLCWLPYWIGQVYLTFTPPMYRHSDVCLTFLLLAGCLSYANSAMNPVLYAFLSENFKKSFAKAFTCAARKDVNAQLHVENSVFPRTTKTTTHGTNVNTHKRSDKQSHVEASGHSGKAKGKNKMEEYEAFEYAVVDGSLVEKECPDIDNSTGISTVAKSPYLNKERSIFQVEQRQETF